MAACLLCPRYTILGCFVVLGVSGLVVCITGGVFAYQFGRYGYQSIDIENLIVSPAILIALGLLTCPLAAYFWWFIDHKYNLLQFTMFSILLVILSSAQLFAGIFALLKYEELGLMLSTSLENSLKTARWRPPTGSPLNHTEAEMNCCSSIDTTEEIFTPWLCCDLQRHQNTTSIDCEEFHATTCRHLTISQYQSIMIHVFLLALCSVGLQISVLSTLFYYASLKKKQMRHTRVSLRRKTSAA